MFDHLPVRLASRTGRVLFNAPRLRAATLGYRRDRFFEYADDLKLTPVQEPGVWCKDDHWIASRPMSDGEKATFLREVEEDNRSVRRAATRGRFRSVTPVEPTLISTLPEEASCGLPWLKSDHSLTRSRSTRLAS